MFLPIDFWGVKMPFTLKGIPIGGWQGIIPSKAAKMGGLTVDTRHSSPTCWPRTS